ncbi:MAG TPA: hypothetical protein DEQ02_08890 [Ruminococcaceae bacterium]|nr:hypothetical protein [Oscillospiraceae bacterium]
MERIKLVLTIIIYILFSLFLFLESGIVMMLRQLFIVLVSLLALHGSYYLIKNNKKFFLKLLGVFKRIKDFILSVLKKNSGNIDAQREHIIKKRKKRAERFSTEQKRAIIVIAIPILFLWFIYFVSVFWESGIQIIYIIFMTTLFILAVYGFICIIKDENQFPKVKKVLRKIIEPIRKRFKKEY